MTTWETLKLSTILMTMARILVLDSSSCFIYSIPSALSHLHLSIFLCSIGCSGFGCCLKLVRFTLACQVTQFSNININQPSYLVTKGSFTVA